MADTRLSQVAIEALVEEPDAPNTRLSQVAIEVLTAEPVLPAVRLSQVVIEVLVAGLITVTLDAGSYVVTGAALPESVTVDAGSYVVTGADADLEAGVRPMTLADMLAWPVREVIVLARAEPSKTLESGWSETPTTSDTWQIPFPTHQARDIHPGGLYAPVIGVREQATDLTERASVVLVDANPGSFFWDAGAETLYIHTTGSVSPNARSLAIQAFVRVHLSSDAIILNESDDDPETAVYYHPVITGDPPVTREMIASDLFGVRSAPSGNLQATNGQQWWWQVLAPDGPWNWKNKRIRFLLAARARGETLNLSACGDLCTMLVEDVACEDEVASWALKPLARKLEIELPRTPFFESEYPNLGEGVRGWRKWIGYGRTTMVPDLVDTATSQGVYLIADATYQNLKAVHSVQAIAKSTGVSSGALSAGVDYTTDLTACTVTVLNAAYPASTHYLLVDVTGKTDDGTPAGAAIDTFAAITRDLLVTFCGVRASEIDEASFVQAASDAPEILSLWLSGRESRRTVLSLLSSAEPGVASLERSVLGLVRQTPAGLWQVKIRSALVATLALGDLGVTLQDTDFAEFKPEPNLESAFTSTRVFFNRERSVAPDGAGSQSDWESVQVTDEVVGHLLETTERIDLYTYLTTEADAQTLAERYQLIAGGVRQLIVIQERGAKLFGSQIGDVVRLTRTPAPTASGALLNEPMELVELEMRFGPAIDIRARVRDMRGLGGGGWAWAPDDVAVLWQDLDPALQGIYGGWADDTTGRIVAGDPATADIRVWA